MMSGVSRVLHALWWLDKSGCTLTTHVLLCIVQSSKYADASLVELYQDERLPLSVRGIAVEIMLARRMRVGVPVKASVTLGGLRPEPLTPMALRDVSRWLMTELTAPARTPLGMLVHRRWKAKLGMYFYTAVRFYLSRRGWWSDMPSNEGACEAG